MSAGENPFGDLLQDYIVECLPLAEQVGDTFVELERRWQSGEPGDDLLTTVKGRLHTIKGNSAMMGIGPARDVAHALEPRAVLDQAEVDEGGGHAPALQRERADLERPALPEEVHEPLLIVAHGRSRVPPRAWYRAGCAFPTAGGAYCGRWG